MEPYAKLVGALLPRVSGLSLFDARGEIRWTSEGSVDPALPALVKLSIAAASRGAEPGEEVQLGEGAPVHLFWLRSTQDELQGVVALTWRPGESASRGLAFVHSMVRPVLEVLHREVALRMRVAQLDDSVADRDRDLDMLLSASDEGGQAAPGGDEVRGILQNTTEHMHCEFATLIMPERNVVVICTAGGRRADTAILGRVHRHLLSLAQVRTGPALLNAADALPGCELPLRILSCPVRTPAGRAAGVLALFRSREAAEFRPRDAQLAGLLAQRMAARVEASYDALSGLLTRQAFEQRARALMLDGDRARRPAWSGVYIDIDRMHVINDNYGMHVGDRLIARMGELVRSSMVPGAMAARISGDRFAILLPSALVDAVAFAEALREGVSHLSAAHLGAESNAVFAASVSVGVAELADVQVDVTHAFALAETACKAAKDRGRNRVETYVATDQSIMRRYDDINIAPNLRAAMHENRMRLDAQLIVPLQAGTHVPHFEILLRMIDDNGETVGPDRFMSAAVRYQLMPAVDRWVLREAVRQLRPHAALLASRPVVFTINLSGQTLNDADFPDFLVDLVKESGIDPRVLCFEVIESAAIANLARAEAFMKRLHGLGCEFALDDFGTGLSSLAYLRALPVNMLKIDGSFVRDILKDPRAESMVQAVAQLARSMDLVTVAEYVETDEIRLRVAALGVDYGQGFAIARPIPLSQVVLDLPAYASAPAQALQAAGHDAAQLHDEDVDAALRAMADRLDGSGGAGEGPDDADDDTYLRLAAILGDYDHSESTLYQKIAAR